ncbi:hypothetical protein MBELCI_3683 [Limimaricola cinnabarinus LL-001]|uniref:Uncharacterized protein n=1 Tax=Limimaricola cinnabarinus LL-001 TaxID=1337093 RepID=U2YQC3_9RHOB|nr:hypothetical protein MBELCI_3683 [Limimaricola cinnabarinus LL-001]
MRRNQVTVSFAARTPLVRSIGLSHALHPEGVLDSVFFETPGNGAEQ